MLIIEKNSVYEIDEECLQKRKIPEECEVYEKMVRKKNLEEQKEAESKKER